MRKEEGEKRERKRRREVVGGSGPYREAGTTLASAILNSGDTHNHLVPLTLSRSTRVVVTHRPFLVVGLVPRREARRFFANAKEKERERALDVFVSSPSSLPLDLPSSFLLRPFQTPPRLPITSLDSPLTNGNFRNFARGHSEASDGETKFRLYFAVGMEREIKAGDLVSFRTSSLLSPVPFVTNGASVNRNFSPCGKKNTEEIVVKNEVVG